MIESASNSQILFRGQPVEYEQKLPISQHNRTGARGDTNGQICTDSSGKPSQIGTVLLLQIGPMKEKQPTPALRCTNCLYVET